MGFILEHNCLLTLSDEQISSLNLTEGATFEVIKEGQRLYPVNIPFEFCDKKNYKYIGKIIVDKISLEKDKTTLQGRIVKVFNQEESKIFSENFISPDNF